LGGGGVSLDLGLDQAHLSLVFLVFALATAAAIISFRIVGVVIRLVLRGSSPTVARRWGRGVWELVVFFRSASTA
jgi:hypothetical protein